MAKAVRIELFIDFEVLSMSFTDFLGQSTTKGIVNTIKKRNKPRDTGDLMDSIRDERISFNQYEVSTDLPYSAAQEYGRPDLQNYTYTPYMEPGAVSGTAGSEMNKYSLDAMQAAQRRARR